MVFPVKIPYVIGPDISKYFGEPYDKGLDPFYISEKRKELNLNRKKICRNDEDTKFLLKKISDYFGFNNIHEIEELALHFNEDIAILQNGILKAICFCFPSSFFPADLIGKSFLSLHEPVPENKNLNRSADKIVELTATIENKFRRFVWTITSLPSLSQLPSYIKSDPEKIEDLYFRTETQTTVGLGEGICLFFVKVEMNPLVNVWNDPEKKNKIIRSIESMSPAIIKYKNLEKIKTILLDN